MKKKISFIGFMSSVILSYSLVMGTAFAEKPISLTEEQKFQGRTLHQTLYLEKTNARVGRNSDLFCELKNESWVGTAIIKFQKTPDIYDRVSVLVRNTPNPHSRFAYTNDRIIGPRLYINDGEVTTLSFANIFLGIQSEVCGTSASIMEGLSFSGEMQGNARILTTLKWHNRKAVKSQIREASLAGCKIQKLDPHFEEWTCPVAEFNTIHLKIKSR
jgi:hypothetical protein